MYTVHFKERVSMGVFFRIIKGEQGGKFRSEFVFTFINFLLETHLV